MLCENIGTKNMNLEKDPEDAHYIARKEGWCDEEENDKVVEAD